MVESEENAILIIDDHEENRYTLRRYLQREGFVVWEAASAKEGIELSRKKPGLIILDVKLPDMLGFEACQMIKDHPETASVPVLHTSATFTHSSDKVQGLVCADGYLAAPVEPQELIATVRALLRMRKAETRAQALADQWQTTFDSISDGICLIDPEGRIERVNKAISCFLTQSGGKIEGRIFQDIAKHELLDIAVFERMLKSLRREVIEMQVADRWLRITADPVCSKTGEYQGAVCIISDITERKRTEDEMRRLNQELERRVAERTEKLEESVQALESFCYSIAHDLRAPLRAMQGFTTALIEDYGEALDAMGKDYARRIGASATRMDQLIRDLLSFGRISHSDLPAGDLDMDILMDQILNQLATEIEAKKAVIDVQKPLPNIHANPTLVEQVIINLLTNAMKFVAPGVLPKVRVWAEARQKAIRFSVQDNGIGIDPAHQKRIFGTFERLHGFDAYPGTGIGLAIVAKGIERMGGQVGVESRAGQGSTFWFELPANHPEET